MERAELAAWLRLTCTPGIGSQTARKLLAHFGPPEQLLRQPPSAWRACTTAAQAQALSHPPEGFAALEEATWQWLHGSDDAAVARRILVLGDADYPAALLHTPDPPVLLYLTGAAAWLGQAPLSNPSLALVGSRNPTAQGAANARAFAEHLRGAGWCIVSGLALGVDGAAHEGALAAAGPARGPATIAVVGTGLDRVYPRAHRALAHRIARHGVIVSEYPLGTPPLAAHFPQRNRIIAGLAQGTVVVEAALASGSLITARLAAEQGREVFAIPGSIHAPQSRGCHALIRQGAQLVETAEDILAELQPWPVPPAAAAEASAAAPVPTPAPPGAAPAPVPTATAAVTPAPAPPPGDAVLDALGYDPVDLDTLSARTGMDAARLQVALLEWELQGCVARLPGGLFQRMARA